MIKKLIAVVVVLVILAVGLVAVLFTYIDSVAKAGIEKGGTYALGVPTEVSSVDVSVLGGTLAMRGLTVANPSGFGADHFLTVDDAGMAVSLGTLREPVVELPNFDLSGLDLALERSGGKANYKTILDNLKRLESAEGEAADSGKSFIIRKVAVRDVNVQVNVEGIATVDLPIKEIILEDVGSANGKGVRIGELASIIVKAVLAAVVDGGGGIIPGDVLGELQGGLAQLESLQEMGVAKVAEIQERVREQTDAINEIGKGIEDVGKEAEKTLQGIGDLLGGKKDK